MPGWRFWLAANASMLAREKCGLVRATKSAECLRRQQPPARQAICGLLAGVGGQWFGRVLAAILQLIQVRLAATLGQVGQFVHQREPEGVNAVVAQRQRDGRAFRQPERRAVQVGFRRWRRTRTAPPNAPAWPGRVSHPRPGACGPSARVPAAQGDHLATGRFRFDPRASVSARRSQAKLGIGQRRPG